MKKTSYALNSVAKGAEGYSPPPPHWLAAQNTEKEKYHIFSTSKTVFCSGINPKSDLKHILKRLFGWGGGGNLSKTKLINQKKNLKIIAKNL